MPAPSASSPHRSSSLEDDLSHLAGPGHGSGTAFLASLRHNLTMAPFLKPQFDAASFSAQVVVADSAAGAGGATTSSLSARSRAEMMVTQLKEQLGQAEAAIERHILQHQRQLMQGMGDLGELRENCDLLTVRSKELRRSVNKLTAELLEPYQGTERRTQQLRRLHEANDILKKISRFSATLVRLKKESGGQAGGDATGTDDPVVAVQGLELRDLAKAAQHLQEVEAFFQDPTLGGISLLAAERPYVTALGRGLRRTAKDSLQAAVQSMNQADMGPALQVFYNLHHLAPVVLECITAAVSEAADATRRAFDPQTLERVASVSTASPSPPSSSSSTSSSSSSSSSSSPTGASSSGRASTAELEAIAQRQRRARFRDHCDKWATALYQCTLQIWHLQRVLHKKVDATTNEGFLDVVLQSTDFQMALEHALASIAGASSSSSSSTRITTAGLKRAHSRGSSNGGGNSSSNSNSNNHTPSSVGALYWMFWLKVTAAIRIVADKAAKRASPSLSTSAAAAGATAGPALVVKCYPYFLLGLTDVLDRLVDTTPKHKLGGALPGTSSGVGGGSQQQQQGNPAALRALMEALGVDEHTHTAMLIEGEEQQQQHQLGGGAAVGSASSSSPSVLYLPEMAGSSVEERTLLVEALGSLRDLYLGESLQRLCRPIEQMFPTQEGYQAAVPSKHDLQALFRVMQTELLTGLAEGGPLLLPHLVRGVVKAVHLFCAKVEAMTNTSEGARKLYALRGWMLGPEKEHNLQLLQLVAFLHQGLRRLPQDLVSASAAGYLGGGGEEQALAEAATALETLAVTGFVHPDMMDIAAELGGILAEMHLENYAPGRQQQQQQQRQDSDGQGAGGNSRFITAFQAAVTGLRKHHLSKLPTQADFVARAFKWLTSRLLRLYVSHAALLRPLNEAGKTKLTNDMAMLETALSSIHPKLSELGAPYLELKGFRELCFYGDEQNPLTVNGLAKERFTAHLRPSTLLDALFARAPLELSSPHVLQRCSERTLVEELLALYYKNGGGAVEGGEVGGAGGKPTDPRLLAESAHWQVVQVCLDAYAQRMSASQVELAYIYDVMLNLGGLLLKGFGDRLVREGRDAVGREGKGSSSSSSVAAVVLPLYW